jgi:hypothetical protein
MLTIRDAQIKVMSTAQFERWVIEHFRTFFRRQCEGRTDAGLLQAARAGIAKARIYGFVKNSDLCRFADVMLVMGAEFDRDPLLPWAAAILNNPEITSSEMRIARLEAATMEHLENPAPPTEAENPEFDEPEDEDDADWVDSEDPHADSEDEEDEGDEENDDEEDEDLEEDGEEDEVGEEDIAGGDAR